MKHMFELLRTPHGSKEETRQIIVKSLMARPFTQAELARRTGFSPGTISAVIKDLSDKGTVEHVGSGHNGRAIRLQPLTGIAVGVELGFRNMAVVARRAHQPYTAAKVKLVEVGAAMGQEIWLENAVAAIRDLAAEVGDHPDDVATVGMGIPRMIGPRDQGLTPPALPPWHDGENPATALTNRLTLSGGNIRTSLKVRLDNDANLGAYAVSVYQYPFKETLVYVKASTGVGAGIMIGGQVLRGATGCAGEIGHVMIQPRGRFCLCGGRGCLETMIGADAMLRDAKAVLGSRSFDPPQSIDQLIERAKAHNPTCVRVLHEAATQLGRSIGALCNVINPNVVVLGGAFGRAGDIVIEPCMEGIRRSSMAATCGDEFLLVSSSVAHATGHGALLMAINGEGRRTDQRSSI